MKCAIGTGPQGSRAANIIASFHSNVGIFTPLLVNNDHAFVSQNSAVFWTSDLASSVLASWHLGPAPRRPELTNKEKSNSYQCASSGFCDANVIVILILS